jgi:hypothetical protein
MATLRRGRPVHGDSGFSKEEKGAVHLGVVRYFGVGRPAYQALGIGMFMVLPKVDAVQSLSTRSLLAARRMSAS